MQKKSEINNWERQGKVMQWVSENYSLTVYQYRLYAYIVKMTAGYGQYTSMPLPYDMMAETCMISISKIKGKGKAAIGLIQELKELKLIEKVGTNYVVTGKGKRPYAYRLNMKLPDFPSLGELRTNNKPKASKIKQSPQYTCLDGTTIDGYESYDGVVSENRSTILVKYCEANGLDKDEEFAKWRKEQLNE